MCENILYNNQINYIVFSRDDGLDRLFLNGITQKEAAAVFKVTCLVSIH